MSDSGKPLYTEEDHDAICRAVDKLSNAEPPDNPIHSPRPNNHPLAIIASRALKAANNADAEIVRLHKLLSCRSPALTTTPDEADALLGEFQESCEDAFSAKGDDHRVYSQRCLARAALRNEIRRRLLAARAPEEGIHG